MRRSMIVVTIFSVLVTLVLPFVGGSGPSLLGGTTSARADEGTFPVFASEYSQSVPAAASASPAALSADAAEQTIEAQLAADAARQAELTSDTEHLAQKPVPEPVVADETNASAASATAARRAATEAAGFTCPGNVGGGTGGAPSRVAGGGLIVGTSSSDLATFAAQYNATRVANCLQPVPLANFRYDSCMEDRLIWMAEDPSDDPASAWGHVGSARSDGVPSRGCDGNLAGGNGDNGASVASKWWASDAHRASLYKPNYAGATAGVCIYFAATHGGVGTSYNEPASFMRAAARWGGC